MNTPQVTYKNYPGITRKGEDAALEGYAVSECPYPLHTPQHTAWIRGYVTARRRMEHQAIAELDHAEVAYSTDQWAHHQRHCPVCRKR